MSSSRLPALERNVLRLTEQGDSGVVEQEIDALRVFMNPLHQSGECLRIAHIQDAGHHLAAPAGFLAK